MPGIIFKLGLDGSAARSQAESAGKDIGGSLKKGSDSANSGLRETSKRMGEVRSQAKQMHEDLLGATAGGSRGFAGMVGAAANVTTALSAGGLLGAITAVAGAATRFAVEGMEKVKRYGEHVREYLTLRFREAHDEAARVSSIKMDALRNEFDSISKSAAEFSTLLDSIYTKQAKLASAKVDLRIARVEKDVAEGKITPQEGEKRKFEIREKARKEAAKLEEEAAQKQIDIMATELRRQEDYYASIQGTNSKRITSNYAIQRDIIGLRQAIADKDEEAAKKFALQLREDLRVAKDFDSKSIKPLSDMVNSLLSFGEKLSAAAEAGKSAASATNNVGAGLVSGFTAFIASGKDNAQVYEDAGVLLDAVATEATMYVEEFKGVEESMLEKINDGRRKLEGAKAEFETTKTYQPQISAFESATAKTQTDTAISKQNSADKKAAEAEADTGVRVQAAEYIESRRRDVRDVIASGNRSDIIGMATGLSNEMSRYRNDYSEVGIANYKALESLWKQAADSLKEIQTNTSGLR